MRAKPEDKNFLTSQDRLLSSLARELKNPLILMARQAELAGKSSSDPAFSSIRETAENTLKLIDSYLLMARSEYGQQALPLEAIGIGSAIYDAVKDLRISAGEQKIDFVTDIKDAYVMANREGLSAIIRCLSEIALTQDNQENFRRLVKIKVRSERQKVSVAILSNQLDITDSELEAATKLQGISHLADAKISDSGIRLAIADMLARSFGTTLSARKVDGLKGFGFDLNCSRQLQLV